MKNKKLAAHSISFPDHPLMDWPISRILSHLNVNIKSASFCPLIDEVLSELNEFKSKFEVSIYLGDEWFSPEGMSAIAIPFYLSHSELLELERKIMFEVEGEESEHFKKLLRHELGHCFDHHYKFSKTREWKKLFGSPAKDYDPDFYRPRPYSKSFVNHLGNWYAQSHPDEDFAETFAVVLDKRSNWRLIYSDWPVALNKLEYVESLLKKENKKSRAELGPLPYRAEKMTMTLRNYYIKKRKLYAQNYPDFFDEDLKEIFNRKATGQDILNAWLFFRKNKKRLEDSVYSWTGEKKYSIHKLVERLENRCKVLCLTTHRDSVDLLVDLTAYLTAQICRYQFTGRFKRSV